jgi:hypothetical protein
MNFHSPGGLQRPCNMANAAFTQRIHSLDEDPMDAATGLRRFRLPDVLEPRVKAYKFVKCESPWNSYEMIDELRRGMAQRKDLPCNVVSVHNIEGQDAKERLRMLQRIQHENFVSVLEVFSFRQSFHVIFEYMPIAISDFADILYYPNELQLASILGQVNYGAHSIRGTGANCSRYSGALPTLCRKG